MMRRTLTIAAGLLATVAISASPASADDLTCTTVDDAPFTGSSICLNLNAATSGTITIPVSVGSVCVAGTCTPVIENLTAPMPNGNVIQAVSTICYGTVPHLRTCRTVDTATLLADWSLGR